MRGLEFGARLEVLYLEASFGVLWERLRVRNERSELFKVSRQELEGYAAFFQPPSVDEGAFWDELTVIRQGESLGSLPLARPLCRNGTN